ncbi:PEP-CTERM sorting domain-containing protein [Rubritalea halochordaticola]
MKALKFIPIITLTAIHAHAATSFIGDPIGTDDNLGTASNWDNGLPGSGNDGSISTDGELGNISIANGGSSVTVTHTGGTIGDPNDEITNYRDFSISTSGGGSLTWQVDGGNYSEFRVFTIGSGVTLNVTDGILAGSGTGGTRLQVASGAVANITGGTFSGMGFWADGSTINLLGGTIDNLVSNTVIRTYNGGTLNIGGDFSINGMASTAVGNNNNFFTGSEWTIAADWTGSMTNEAWGRTEWVTEIESTTLTVGGVQINDSNFDDYFTVNGTGTLTAIPEPSSSALLGLGGLALIMRRRK